MRTNKSIKLAMAAVLGISMAAAGTAQAACLRTFADGSPSALTSADVPTVAWNMPSVIAASPRTASSASPSSGSTARPSRAPDIDYSATSAPAFTWALLSPCAP